MTRAAWLLAWRSLWDRPRRTLLLLVGYGIGVAVMIALLSVGEALLAQAQDRDLVAGGDLVLLPEGIDPSVLKVNGVTGLYLAIQQAGFVTREVLRGPRFGPEISAAAPQIDGRQVYVRAHGTILPTSASAGIPSLDRAARATAAVPGARDSAGDRAWNSPAPGNLADQLDRFHRPPSGKHAAWAEWDYFNFVDPASGAYGYMTLLAGGEGRGAVLVRLRQKGRPSEDLTIPAMIRVGDLSVDRAEQRIGPAWVRIDHGRYHVTVDDSRLRADLWLTPDGGYYLPPGEFTEGELVSGYVVPVVQGRMSGEIRTERTALNLVEAPAYHDHNWGTWTGVTWDWGEASGARGAVLYGGLHLDRAHAAGGRAPALFLWGAARQDGGNRSGGFLAALPVRSIGYAGWHPGPVLDGRRIDVPTSVTIDAGRAGDSVRVRFHVRDALASSAGQTAVSKQSGVSPSGRATSAFLQLRGEADVRGTLDGAVLEFTGLGAAETYVPLAGRGGTRVSP